MVRIALERQWQGDHSHAVHDGYQVTGGAEKALKATRHDDFTLLRGIRHLKKGMFTCALSFIHR